MIRENPVLENCLILDASISLESHQPVPGGNNRSCSEDNHLIARARAVGVHYEFAQPDALETEDDRRKRHRRNQRRISEQEKRLREVVGDLPPPPPAGSSQQEDNTVLFVHLRWSR